MVVVVVVRPAMIDSVLADMETNGLASSECV